MDVRTNYNSNCPACISIQGLIGKEKLETDPANTYWGGGAYQKEVEHLQMGVWPCSDCEGLGFNWLVIQETPVFIREKEPCYSCIKTGMVFLHAPLLIGGVHENLLGRAASLLRDYNQNGNCNILEMGQDEECYECGGTGERDCYNCDGGTKDCYRCDGTGEIEDEKGEDEVCSDCDGTGEEVCSDCEGENWCVECGGSGEFWNENLISGIKETYQDAIDYIYANANDSQVRTALNQLVQGLESGQLRTTSGSEMYNEANKKLYNDLHDALIYYVINTPNRPVPAEEESFNAETFAADCCRECGRKEGPYADTVLIGCPNCPELTCQHCYDETNQSCEFCVKKQAENIPNGLVVKNFKTTSKIYYNQNLVRQFKGSRHREEADSVAEVYFRRLSLNPNYFNYRFRAETFESEGKPTIIQVKRSTNDEKKLMAVFTYPDGKTKTTHFGQRGASDYTKHGEKDRMELYLERHAGKAPSYTTSSREDWKDPTTAGALSRWILWNKPSLSASFNDFKKRFNLKGDLKVKRSAETFDAEIVEVEMACPKCNINGIFEQKEGRIGYKLFCKNCNYSEWHEWNSESFEAEEENAKKLREYEKTYGKKQAKIRMRLKKKIYKEKSMGTKSGQWSARKSQKLKREYEAACERASLNPYKGRKTEKQDNLEDWSDQDWKTSSGKKSSKTGEPYFPAKAVAALKKKGLYAKAKRQKAKATKEGKQNARYSDDIRKVVTKYRAEETFEANDIGSLNYPSLLMFNYWKSKLPRLTYEEYVKANNLGYGLEKLLEINSVPERCEHKNTEPDDVFIFNEDWGLGYRIDLMWQCPDCTRVGSASADYETEGEFWGTDPSMYDVFWEDKTRIIPFRGDHPDNYRELPSINEDSWSSVFGAETFEQGEPPEYITFEGKDYIYDDFEATMATPEGILYLYKTYHEPTGTVTYPIIKLYNYEGKIKEWTYYDQKEFDIEVQAQLSSIQGKVRSHKMYW